MSKARTLANLISDNAELADGQISVAEVVGAAPLASPTFTGTATVSGNVSVDGGTIKLDGNYPVGTNNVALGDGALDDVSLTGASNVAVGTNSLTANTSGYDNTAIGVSSLTSNNTGHTNTAVGGAALNANTTGQQNIALGNAALLNSTTGSYNVALGRSALLSNTTADNNTAVGYQAGYSNTTGSRMVAVGQAALYSNTTGDRNLAVGRNSGYYITTGSKNVILGSYNGNQDGLDIRTSNNNIVLSDGDGNVQLHINSDGWHTQYGPLYSYSSSTVQSNITIRNSGSGADGTDYLQCRNSGNGANLVIEPDGDVKNTNNTYGALSDAKLKENIIDATSQWDDLKAIQVRKYNLIGSSVTQLGVVAQELEVAGMSGLVSDRADKDDDGNDLGTVTKNVKYSILYMKAVKALQEAMDRIETLEADVAALKNP